MMDQRQIPSAANVAPIYTAQVDEEGGGGGWSKSSTVCTPQREACEATLPANAPRLGSGPPQLTMGGSRAGRWNGPASSSFWTDSEMA